MAEIAIAGETYNMDGRFHVSADGTTEYAGIVRNDGSITSINRNIETGNITFMNYRVVDGQMVSISSVATDVGLEGELGLRLYRDVGVAGGAINGRVSADILPGDSVINFAARLPEVYDLVKTIGVFDERALPVSDRIIHDAEIFDDGTTETTTVGDAGIVVAPPLLASAASMSQVVVPNEDGTIKIYTLTASGNLNITTLDAQSEVLSSVDGSIQPSAAQEAVSILRAIDDDNTMDTTEAQNVRAITNNLDLSVTR